MPMHRSLKVLAAALLTATLLSGCSVFSARTIRAGIVGEPAGLELAYTDDASALVGSMVHAGLYRADATFAPIPVLADGDASSAAGGTKWRVTLRSGLTFHDGSPLTADDVVFTYELAASTRCPLVSDICAVVGNHLVAVEAGADGALTFTLKSPWAPWQTRGLTIPILPKATLTASLARLQAKVQAADRNAVSLTRENIAADIDGGGCAASGGTNCTYASRVTELERTLADAGLDLPDPRGYPQLSSAGEPTGSRDDEQYARALYAQLTALEGLLLSPTDGQLGGLCRNLASDLGYRGENDMVGNLEASTSINFSTAPTRSHLLAWWGTFPYCREITNAPHGLAYGYAFAAAEAQLHDRTDTLFRLPEGVRGEKAARKGKNMVNTVGRLFHHLCLPIDHALGTAISSEPFLEALRAAPALRPLILCDPGTLTQAQLDTPNAIFMTMHRRQPLLLYREVPLSWPGTRPIHSIKWEVGDRVVASTADHKPAHGAISSVKAGGHFQITTDDGTILPIRGANKMRAQFQLSSPPGAAASLPAAPRD
jgi:hypothetical protein